MACTQCGLSGVEGICSMCYGDIDHNTDGAYRSWAEQQWEEEAKKQDPEQHYKDCFVNEPKTDDLPF